MASAASTTAGKPSVSTIPTAIDISLILEIEFLFLPTEKFNTQESSPVDDFLIVAVDNSDRYKSSFQAVDKRVKNVNEV
jgi:hypothetical protein